MTGMLISLLNSANQISNQFVFNGYAELVSDYRTAILSLAGLSIIIFGYAVINGWVQLSQAEMTKRLLVMSFALSLALHWDLFSEYIYNLFTIAPDQIGMSLVKSIPGSSYSDQNSLFGALQDFFNKGMKYGDDVWALGSFLKGTIMPFVWAGLMWLMTILFAGIALAELIIAKFSLAILLVLSPLAIPMIMFQATKSAIFDGWLRGVITFALVPIFVMASVTLSLMLDGNILQDVYNSIHGGSLSITALAPYILCTLINIIFVLKATFMAANMAGGMSTGIGGAIGGYIAGRISRGGAGKNKEKNGKSEGKNTPSNQDETPPSN